MKISKKIISVLLVLTLTIPMLAGCAKTAKEQSENTEENKKIVAEAKEKLKEV